MKSVQRETTGPDEDDMPVGTEAVSIPRSKKPIEENGDADKSSVKRFRWISAIERTQGSSLTSSATSNSSVEQFLQQREMDPETLLCNLGFGATINTEDSVNKIPERFLLSQQTTHGIDLYEFVLNHPELHHLLPIWEKNLPLQGTSRVAECPTPLTNGAENRAQFQQQVQSTKGAISLASIEQWQKNNNVAPA